MHHPNLSKATRRALRFTGPVPSLLQSVASGGPLYLHARNWMAELASIVTLSGMVTDEDEKSAFFPEEGLQLSLGAVEAVHGVEIEYRTRQALALEIATHGEPRSLSVVAIPNISEMDHFTRCLNHHPADILLEEEYQQWRDGFIIRPVICPCCQAAADERRAFPERNPLTRIFCHAIEQELELRCSLISPVIGFTTWLRPKNLQLSNGILGVIAEDGKSMLEIDFGVCHTLRILCRLVDDEPFTEMNLYDSLGHLHFKIAARGWGHDRVWRGLCG
ncbi:MAG: hypothetical protein V4584_17590 [Verrucomicrobiota bacterium]